MNTACRKFTIYCKTIILFIRVIEVTTKRRHKREGGILGIKPVEDLLEIIGNNESKVKQITCVKCQTKCYFSCSNCSEL